MYVTMCGVQKILIKKSIKALKMLTELRGGAHPNINVIIGTALMEPALNKLIEAVEVAKELDVEDALRS